MKRQRESYSGDSYTSSWRRKRERQRQRETAPNAGRTDHGQVHHPQPEERSSVDHNLLDEDSALCSVPGDIEPNSQDLPGCHVTEATSGVFHASNEEDSIFADGSMPSRGNTVAVSLNLHPNSTTPSASASEDNNLLRASRQVSPEMPEDSIHHSMISLPSFQDCEEGEESGNASDRSSLHSIHLSSIASGHPTSSDHSGSDGDSDTDSILCDPDSFVAHYLEEAPLMAPEGDEGDSDPDDPGDNSEESSDENHSSEEESADSDGELAAYTSEELDAQAALVNNITKGQLILIQLATALRHNKTFECLLDDNRNMNVLLGKNWLPESKPKLFDCINLKKGAAKFYAYCGNQACGSFIGRKDRLPQNVRCPQCRRTTPISKTHFFVMFNFRKQLQTFLQLPGIWEKLQYRHNREKMSPTGLEDVYDSSRYIEMRAPGGPLESEFDFSFIVNTDAFKPFKKAGKLKAWPIFARINELPPDMRQRFSFLVALYVDTHDPNFQSFLKPFVAEANRLATVGIRWRPDGLQEQVSKFLCFSHCVDSPARCGILQMNSVTGYFGCTYCLQEGVQLAGSGRYAFIDEEGNYIFTEDRTHDGMVEDMLASRHAPDGVRGHKGLSQLMLLQNFDLRQSQAHDDLHQDHEGCAKDLTEMLLTDVNARVGGRDVAAVDIIREVDRRLLPIKTPSILARKPSSISKRGSYRGSAWRNWLLYYAVPCLIGLIRPAFLNLLAHLSHGCYRLSQDVIEEHDFVQADRNFKTLGQQYQEKFGLHKVKFNLHATVRHKVRSVRTLGPPWNTSTYNFESLNFKLGPMITSPKGIMSQVVSRCFLNLTVSLAMYDEALPQRVRDRLKEIASKLKLKRIVQVGPHTYAVGKPTRRLPTPQEVGLLRHENLHVQRVHEYPSVQKGRIRYKSIHNQEDSLSDDSFIYTTEDTFCTIDRVLVFTDENREDHCGLIVHEHDVARHLQVASHIAVLRENDANLMHYIDIAKVKCPAVKYNIDGLVYAVPLANCREID